MAGGGIFDVPEAEAPAEAAACGDMADVGGKYDGGDIASGVATGWLRIDALPMAAAAEDGPFEEMDGVLFSFSLSVGFLFFSISALACKLGLWHVKVGQKIVECSSATADQLGTVRRLPSILRCCARWSPR